MWLHEIFLPNVCFLYSMHSQLLLGWKPHRSLYISSYGQQTPSTDQNPILSETRIFLKWGSKYGSDGRKTCILFVDNPQRWIWNLNQNELQTLCFVFFWAQWVEFDWSGLYVEGEWALTGFTSQETVVSGINWSSTSTFYLWRPKEICFMFHCLHLQVCFIS